MRQSIIAPGKEVFENERAANKEPLHSRRISGDGARIAGSPDGLASALRKLEHYARGIPMDNPNPAMNNMFIVEPFFGRGGGMLGRLFATHPPTEARIRALLEG